jgi:hypothetical protein
MSNSKDLTSAHECEENLNITFEDLGTIRAATDNFSSERKLGEGGFGPVYKVISLSIGKRESSINYITIHTISSWCSPDVWNMGQSF